MRIGFFGDVMGRSGRKALEAHLPRLIRRLDLDFVVVNGENAAGGFGITKSIFEGFRDLGADVITTGNHAYDKREDVHLFNQEDRILRPANFPDSNPGKGYGVYKTRNDQLVGVIHVQGQLFMPLSDTIAPILDKIMDEMIMGQTVDAILVDVHGEATSEKYAIGHYLDGQVSLVVGTHTHIPTADHHIMEKGTGFMCDAGMCGDYDSVIGMEKSGPVYRFATKMQGDRLAPASGDATVCGVMVETDNATGLAKNIEPIRVGGVLSEYQPLLK